MTSDSRISEGIWSTSDDQMIRLNICKIKHCVKLKREKSIHHHFSIQGANLGNLNVTKWGTIIPHYYYYYQLLARCSTYIIGRWKYVSTWHHNANVLGMIFFLLYEILHNVYCYANFLYVFNFLLASLQKSLTFVCSGPPA